MTISNLTRQMANGYLLFIALFATSAFANRIPVHTNEVEISLDYDPADGRQHDLESVWAKACKQLGKALERNSGPWGFGLFSEHDCLPWDRQLAVDANSSKSSDVWLVRLRVRKDKTTISMHWPPAGTQALGTVDINSKLALNHLTSEAFAKIIAASLLDSSPILTQISSDGTESRRRRGPEIVDDKVLNLPDPPSSLRIFRLDFDEGKKIFLPKSLGVAKISQESDGTQEWQIEKIQPTEGPVYAIAEAGRDSMSTQLQNAKENAVAHLDRKAEDDGKLNFSIAKAALQSSTAAGYIGLRYGKSLDSDPLTSQIGFYGLFVELRGAPLNGLVFYHDVSPKVKIAPVSNSPAGSAIVKSFSSSRTVFGWSFEYEPKRFIDVIDFVPKFGRSSNSSDIMVFTTANNATTERFESKSSLSLGAEIGIWFLRKNFDARLWHARDFGLSAGGADSDSSDIFDTKYGVDVYFKGQKIPSFGRRASLSYLLLGLSEHVELKKKTSATSVNGINYDLTYLGGGVALSY